MILILVSNESVHHIVLLAKRLLVVILIDIVEVVCLRVEVTLADSSVFVFQVSRLASVDVADVQAEIFLVRNFVLIILHFYLAEVVQNIFVASEDFVSFS